MFRYVPYVLGVIVLTGATWWQAKIVDRWGMSSIPAEVLEARFVSVPLEIGPWKGVDHEVDDEVKEVAGAVAHVNRVYKNEETGDEVALWLIAGHAKDIVRHTPDICYPAQGYRQVQDAVQHDMPTSDGSEAVFWTTKFRPETEASAGERRVFWAWSIDSEDGAPPEWKAPGDARRYYRNTTALYKMYFTTVVPRTKRNETAANSPCSEFAKICIPEVNAAIFAKSATAPEGGAGATDGVASTDPS